jgi:DNA ligase-1
MLAHDGANHEKKINGLRLLEPKLDGVRCITIIDKDAGTVVQYTRNGKVLENFSHIANSLLANIDAFDRSYVIDGEVVSNSFQALMKQVHRKDDVQASDARLMAFDILPLKEFKNGRSMLGQKQRSLRLKSYKDVLKHCGVDVIEQKEVDLDSYVGELEFKQFNKDAIAAGFEGIMIKMPDAVYECKRSTSWLKQKPFIEVSLTVVGVEEGTGKNEGRMGAIICEGVDDGKTIAVNVGSGFTDDQRTEFWMGKDDLVGQIVEIRADAATISQDSEQTWSLRFPRFLRFRGFKAGEKL